jgi:tetratricopeptide (TPR) repeat protein
MFGSWVASTTLADYITAVRFAEAGRAANPNNPHLLAQLVFCYASLGKLGSAQQLLSNLEDTLRFDTGDRSAPEWRPFLAADRGLIAFRQGKIDEGRGYYDEAIRLSSEGGWLVIAATAQIYRAREEARVNPSEGRLLLDKCRGLLDHYPASIRPFYEQLIRLPVPPRPREVVPSSRFRAWLRSLRV